MGADKKILEIFYADDDNAERVLFEIALDDIPIDAHLLTAKDGEEAIEFLKNSDGYVPDLIFLDLKMPRKDGCECLDEIRKHEKFNRTPVIIFSNSFEDKDIKTAYKHHANLFVQKPFGIMQQVDLMSKIMTLNWEEYFPQPAPDKFVFNFIKERN